MKQSHYFAELTAFMLERLALRRSDEIEKYDGCLVQSRLKGRQNSARDDTETGETRRVEHVQDSSDTCADVEHKT